MDPSPVPSGARQSSTLVGTSAVSPPLNVCHKRSLTEFGRCEHDEHRAAKSSAVPQYARRFLRHCAGHCAQYTQYAAVPQYAAESCAVLWCHSTPFVVGTPIQQSFSAVRCNSIEEKTERYNKKKTINRSSLCTAPRLRAAAQH